MCLDAMFWKSSSRHDDLDVRLEGLAEDRLHEVFEALSRQSTVDTKFTQLVANSNTEHHARGTVMQRRILTGDCRQGVAARTVVGVVRQRFHEVPEQHLKGNT